MAPQKKEMIYGNKKMVTQDKKCLFKFIVIFNKYSHVSKKAYKMQKNVRIVQKKFIVICKIYNAYLEQCQHAFKKFKTCKKAKVCKLPLSVSKPADLGQGSRTVHLRIEGNKRQRGHDVYPGLGPLEGGKTLLPA